MRRGKESNLWGLPGIPERREIPQEAASPVMYMREWANKAFVSITDVSLEIPKVVRASGRHWVEEDVAFGLSSGQYRWDCFLLDLFPNWFLLRKFPWWFSPLSNASCIPVSLASLVTIVLPEGANYLKLIDIFICNFSLFPLSMLNITDWTANCLGSAIVFFATVALALLEWALESGDVGPIPEQAAWPLEPHCLLCKMSWQ